MCRTVRAHLGWIPLTLLTACTGLISDPGASPSPDGPRPDSPTNPSDPVARRVSTGPAVGRRLTAEEYLNSIEVILGLDVESTDLPRDHRIPEGFRNDAESLLLSPARVRAYDSIAESAVAAADVGALVAAHAPCTDPTAECREGFVRSMGLLVLRRPVPDAELGHYLPLFDVAVEEGEDFEAGAGLVLRTMLQSPRFLYRLEVQAPEGGEGLRRVDPYELATRLSFLVWNAGPDAELVAAAAEGRLEEEIEAQVRRLLNHPRARRALRQYVEQWLYLDAIPEGLPLRADMQEETYRFFERLVWEENADLMEAFSSRETELSGPLAEHYGLTRVADGFTRYPMPEERMGFLTQASVMSARTINPSSSMIDRGLFVLNDVFCDSVPPPEGDALRDAIEEQMVPETSGLSQRDRFAMQSEDPLCAGCHAKFDPLGLPFETFDPAGGFITEDEHGNALTGHGVLVLDGEEVAYANAVEFTQALSGSETVARCLVGKSLQHAYGRKLGGTDGDLLDELYTRFVDSGRSYRELIVSIALHPDFGVVEVAE